MQEEALSFSTGIPSLDEVLQGVLPGDNIVWQVDEIEDFAMFVDAFAFNAHKNNQDLIYFRFASHRPLVPEKFGAHEYTLHPEEGFEPFISEILRVIEKYGRGGCYVFDSLSDLAVDWYSDIMLANFFMITCPYLFDYETAAYFALTRGHNPDQVKEIHNTAQVVLDLIKNPSDGQHYILPLKVENRYTPTMYTLHKWLPACDDAPEGNCMTVLDSVTSAEILSQFQHEWLNFTEKPLDVWSRCFKHAQGVLKKFLAGKKSQKDLVKWKDQLLRMAVARDEERIELAEKYLDLRDLIEIGRRMIGTGLIGGKSLGFLLGRAILQQKREYWKKRLEVHDSFFVGSDVFYTFLVKNGCWWGRRRLSNPNMFLQGIEETREKILGGQLPDYVISQFKEMLNYFGQSPIIVRSSSLLEDAFGNSFSGKYDSVYCANQGTPEERLEKLIDAVRQIYASTVSIKALQYRRERDLLGKDEQMALLVQRVSGFNYGNYFFPHLAGVGFSFNPFVWNERIDPKAGVLRLVLGLGTRAVDRTGEDYTRLVALNEPALRLETNIEEISQYSQRKVDLIDLRRNTFSSETLEHISEEVNIPINLLLTENEPLAERLARSGRTGFAQIITFDGLLSKTSVVADFRNMLRELQDAYGQPVDIEFTVNFITPNDYKINLLQCRPFQVRWNQSSQIVELPENLTEENRILEMKGPIIGNSINVRIDRLILIVPATYGKMAISDRHMVARLVGKICHLPDAGKKKSLIIGPGRWGTSSPSLGIPVSFAEISNFSIIGEMAEMHEGLIPDVSLGTHFFNDLVELDLLYFAFYPDRAGNELNLQFFYKSPNGLAGLIPGTESLEHAIKVLEGDELENNQEIRAVFDTFKQRGAVFLSPRDA